MKLSVDRITQADLSQLLLEYAFKEGWYYSHEDIHFYLNNPYNKIYSIKVDNELAGGVVFHKSASHFQGKFLCSGGAFLVAEKYRGQKTVGLYLWQQAIADNLNHDTIACFHSVPKAYTFYERLGFKKTTLVDKFYTLKIENMTWNAHVPTLKPGHEIKKISLSDFPQIQNYNQKLFCGDIGVGFHEFIGLWLKRSDSIVYGYFVHDRLQGYGVATTCGLLEGKLRCYKFSPIYADHPEIASALLKHLVRAVKSNAYYIELSSQAIFESEFGAALQEIGFVESGRNFIVSNQPELIDVQSPLLQKVFSTVPLEYPPEAIATAVKM